MLNAIAMFLSSLHQIPEEELESAASILPTHQSPLSRLHTSDKHMQVAIQPAVITWLANEKLPPYL